MRLESGLENVLALATTQLQIRWKRSKQDFAVPVAEWL